jgi:hypothetical protein
MNDRAEQIAERELRKACVHEAAHELLVHRFGGYATAHIWRNESEGAAAGTERAWLGQVRMFAEPGANQMNPETRAAMGVEPKPPSDWRTLVGLAGLVAEYMSDGVEEAWQIEEDIRSNFECGEVSPTDADLIGENWNEESVSRVMALLNDLWPQLETRAAWLERTASE